jgi:hypothetical protein
MRVKNKDVVVIGKRSSQEMIITKDIVQYLQINSLVYASTSRQSDSVHEHREEIIAIIMT